MYLLAKAILRKLPDTQIPYAPSHDFLYGMTIVGETTIEPFHASPSLLEQIQVVTIADVLEMQDGDLVSLYARILECSDIQETTNRSNQRNVKRELTLKDQSTDTTICCTIWADVARNFVFVPGQVVLIKDATIVVWTSKTISIKKSSKLFIDPKTTQAKQLKL